MSIQPTTFTGYVADAYYSLSSRPLAFSMLILSLVSLYTIQYDIQTPLDSLSKGLADCYNDTATHSNSVKSLCKSAYNVVKFFDDRQSFIFHFMLFMIPWVVEPSISYFIFAVILTFYTIVTKVTFFYLLIISQSYLVYVSLSCFPR